MLKVLYINQCIDPRLHNVSDSGDGGLDGLIGRLNRPGDPGELLDGLHQPGVEG